MTATAPVPLSASVPAPSPGLPAELSRLILDTITDGIYLVDTERRITYWNRGAEVLSGFPRGAVCGRSCQDGILTHIDASGRCLCQDGCPLAATMCDRQNRHADVFMHHRDGHRVPVRVQSFPLLGAANRIVGALEVFQDNGAQATTQKALRTLATLALTDPLTGLPNRRSLDLRVQTALQEFRTVGTPLAVILADIDHFKLVNDRHGHDVGDKALVIVAKTLASAVPAGAIVGRWGGEEFLALVAGQDIEALRLTAERIRMLVEHAYLDTPRGIMRLTISLGAALATPEDTPETLAKKADACLYQSKSNGRNQVTLHRPFDIR